MDNSYLVRVMALFYLIYGALCFAGISIVPGKYRGKPFDKAYKKVHGTTYMMVGVCWLAAGYIIGKLAMLSVLECVILIVTALPGIIYSTKQEREFRKMDEELANEAAKIAEAAGEDGEE